MAIITDIAAVPIEPEYCCSMLKRALPSAMCMTSSCCRPIVMELLYIMLKPVMNMTWKITIKAMESFWAKMMGYRAWAAQDINITPPFNVYSTKYIDMSNPLITISAEDLVNNGSFYVYYSITK